jgi:hypothetical protein
MCTHRALSIERHEVAEPERERLDKYYTSALAREDVAGYRKNDSAFLCSSQVMPKLESFYDFFFCSKNEFIQMHCFHHIHL